MDQKDYISPKIEIVNMRLQDVLAASTYVPEPEVPTRAGDDNPIDDL